MGVSRAISLCIKVSAIFTPSYDRISTSHRMTDKVSRKQHAMASRELLAVVISTLISHITSSVALPPF